MENVNAPKQGDWILEELGSSWEVFQLGGRRGRVFSHEEYALAVICENARRSGGDVWRLDELASAPARVLAGSNQADAAC